MAENIFIASFGVPCEWICPDCGVLFVLYPGLPFDRNSHNCKKLRRAAPKECRCWYRLIDDHRVESFVVEGLVDPDGMSIETLAPDGTKQSWERRRENGLDVFYPPKCYRDAEFYSAPLAFERGAFMQPGPNQILRQINRPEQERLALHNRKSVDLGRR